MGENSQSIKTFKATLPEIVVTRNRNQSRWFGFQPNTFVTMVRPEKKKPKSSWRWVSSRTKQFTGNSVSQPVLTGLGYVADATNKAISGLATSNTTPTGIYSVQSPQQMRTNQQVKQEVENTLNEKVWPAVMPSNYLTALFSEGSLNPYRGAEIKSTWSPTQQLLTVPLDIWASKKVGQGVGKTAEIPRFVVDKAAEAGFQPAKAVVIAREINQATKNKLNIEVLDPTKYNISDNITLYRANPTNIKNLSYKGERYGDTSGQYVGKWFTDESSKPNWYASNMAKRGEEPAHYQVTVPRYWAEKQKASRKISNSNIEYEPEDYIIEDGINGLQGQLYQGRPGTIQYLQQNFQTPVIKEPSTSLKFFERPSKISEAERAGATKWERNFKPKWHVANYPGYQLKGLMKGSQLERQLSKNGTINVNQLNAYFNKTSQLEREVVNKVLAEKFAGQKTIDYNQFKKAVQDELIGSYNRVPQTEWADYGVESLGYNLKTVGENELPGLPNQIILGQPIRYTPPGTKADPISLSTFTFESSRIPYGNTKHYGGNPLGHSRTYTLPEDPRTLYVMESQSDWAQQGLRKKTNIDAQSAYERASQAAAKHQQEIEQMKANLEKGLAPDGHKIQYEWERRDIEEIIKHTEKQLSSNNARAARFDAILHPEKYVQENYLKQNYLQRQLQENLRYASENGQTKMRYPTSETAAKIEGYTPTETIYKDEFGKVYSSPFEHDQNIKLRLDDVVNQLRQENLPNLTMEEYENLLREEQRLANEYSASLKRIPGLIETKGYAPAHQTILKKYADFPKLFQKLYKERPVRTVTDAKGNTWYEVDVPKNYLNVEWQFKKGGQLISKNIITQFKNKKSTSLI